MTFPGAIRTCLKNYFTFSGRASRSEYWFFALFVIVGGLVLGVVDGILFGGSIDTGDGQFRARSTGVLAPLFQLLTIVPMLSAGWRRMHDTGRSGLFLLYPLIVMVGLFTFLATTTNLMAGGLVPDISGMVGMIAAIATLILFVSPLIVIWWLTRPTQPGTNTYGPNPYEVTS